MSHHNVLKTFDNLYDAVRGDKDEFIDEEAFTKKVDELVDIGFIRTGPVDDFTVYQAKNGLKWADFVHIDDSIKKSILLELVENPTTFFVLQNTQKGKMRIASSEIKAWGQDKVNRVVAFIIVDNDKTLADQSVDGLAKVFGDQPVKIYSLSSNNKTDPQDIVSYIDAYANYPDYPMPIIALLGNVKQNEKMLKLLHHINKRVIDDNSQLRYGIIWDEADKTYCSLRDKVIRINGNDVSHITYINEQTRGLYRLGFVTATDGKLLDEDYPECANAYLYPVDISPEDQGHYRALHHPESTTHRVAFTSKHTNNSYATQVLDTHPTHFMQPITLSSGETYYRKIIVNSNAKTDDMKQFAKWCNTKGMYALVFNGYGGASVKVYREGAPVLTFKTKGKKFNEVLFYIYKKLNLNDKPLAIIGRRKVDRGLGFHYCPRTNDEIHIDGTLGVLTTKNREGLVWTDVILGRIEDKDTAVQKAGRLAGIIGNSPQYPGKTHYWTDEHTEQLIRRHNTIVDKSNTNTGCSVLQAVGHAKDNTPVIKVNHRVDLDLFLVYTDEGIVRKVCEMLDYQYRSVKPATKETAKSEGNIGFRETSLNTEKTKVSLLDAINKVPTAYGSQEKDKENEDITQRPSKYVKINDDTKVGDYDISGKFGILQDKINEKEYNISIDNVIHKVNRDNFNLITYRTCYPCYKDIDDKDSLHFVIIIRPGMNNSKIQLVKDKYPSIEIPEEGDF
jgi:hypothetical protein